MPVAAILPAILGAGGAIGASAISSSGQRSAARTAEQIAAEELALKKQILGVIMPFAKQLIALGIDPIKFASSPLGQSILGIGRQAISGEFEQSRMNLIDALAGSGISPGSGLGASPLANMFSSEAAAQAGLTSQLPLQGLQLGLQGAGLLQGLPNLSTGQAGLLGLAGQPSLLSQSFANLPGAVAAAINQYNASQAGPLSFSGIPNAIAGLPVGLPTYFTGTSLGGG